VQTEQTIKAEGATYLPGLTKLVGGVEETFSTSETTQADTDPATGPTGYDRESVGPQTHGFQIAGGPSAWLLSWADGGDGGETASATAAGGASSCNSQTDGLPCGFGRVNTPDGGLDSDYGDYDQSMYVVTDNLGVAELLRVEEHSTDTTSYVRRTGAGPAGLVRGNVSWSLPEIRLGGVLSGMDTPHNNWEGYWVRLTGFTATAQAESGPGAAAPTLSVTGTIRYWRNNNYSTATVTSNGGNLTQLDNVTYSDQSVGPNSDRVDLDIIGTVTVERSSLTRAIVSGGATSEASANVASPLVAEFIYRIVREGVTEADLTVTFTAGRARVGTSYRPVAG
jgi:hypothetical protein